jgi:cysteine desulfurase/selenocysteine lyase
MQYARAYLDNAATSWPKPPAVYEAVDQFARELGVSAARGTHADAMQARRIVEGTRAQLRLLLGAHTEDAVVFCFNGTDALNLCIHGALRPGDHVIATVTDHNSVLRPLRELEKSKSIVVDLAACDPSGRVSTEQIERLLTPSTRLVVMPHASNVSGCIQPVMEIGAMVRKAGSLFLIDAAQTAGDIPVDLHGMHADMIATSGHKGLLGPLGTGVAAIRGELVDTLSSFRQGGTGTQSEADQQPEKGEAKYESGSLNLPGIAGLGAGLDFLRQNVKSISDHKKRLLSMLIGGLQELHSVTIYGDPSPDNRVAVVSFNLIGLDCHELAMLLESQSHIQLRAGLHCAPHMHQALGTIPRGGTVRASLGPFNTDEHVQRLLDTLQTLTEPSRSLRR